MKFQVSRTLTYRIRNVNTQISYGVHLVLQVNRFFNWPVHH